jgi:hypothetical protein
MMIRKKAHADLYPWLERARGNLVASFARQRHKDKAAIMMSWPTDRLRARSPSSSSLNVKYTDAPRVFERALAHPEDIGSLTSQYPRGRGPGYISGEQYDLLDGDSRLSLIEDCCVGVPTP